MENQVSKKLAEEFLGAYKDHNFDAIRTLMHPDVEWTLPGNGKISGTAIGPDAIVNRLKAIIDSGIRTTLHHVLIGQNGVTLSLHNNAVNNDGLVLDEELATVLTVKEERVIKIDTYLSDVPMMERYFQK